MQEKDRAHKLGNDDTSVEDQKSQEDVFHCVVYSVLWATQALIIHGNVAFHKC